MENITKNILIAITENEAFSLKKEFEEMFCRSDRETKGNLYYSMANIDRMFPTVSKFFRELSC